MARPNYIVDCSASLCNCKIRRRRIRVRRICHSLNQKAHPNDPTGMLYDFELGMTVQKFRKYPGDVRLAKYKNLGGGKREGMFLFGNLEYTQNGIKRKLKAPEMPYDLCIRDAVGQFHYMKEDKWLTSANSDMTTGDYNSGWYTVKYPMYSDTDPGAGESDFAEIRLPEIIYALAECKLRKGDATGAGKLLNSVRRRYYPQAMLRHVLYAPEGNVDLDMDENVLMGMFPSITTRSLSSSQLAVHRPRSMIAAIAANDVNLNIFMSLISLFITQFRSCLIIAGVLLERGIGCDLNARHRIYLRMVVGIRILVPPFSGTEFSETDQIYTAASLCRLSRETYPSRHPLFI